MFVEAVPEQTRRNLAILAQAGITRPFYLAGGAAAAFHLGHRISVDDFRDFVDLYFVCQSRMTLAEALEWHSRKFADLNINVLHLIRSLVYFEDAEADPTPEMLEPVSWPDMRRFFEREARELLRQL